MARDTTPKGKTPEISVQTIFALLTVVGGILIVANKLTSHRPTALSGRPNVELSEQLVDLRLWEDPFSPLDTDSYLNRLGQLTNEIATRGDNFELLAVMVPGGPASEEREARIRSRFAIVSALDYSGFAPKSENQIGIGQMQWPSSLQISNQSCDCLTTIRNETRTNNYAFEWFEQEPFAPVSFTNAPAPLNNTSAVLLLWLDEDAFSDQPAARLGLFLERLGKTNNNFVRTNWITNGSPHVSVIGPYYSGTLRSMCDTNNPASPPCISKILRSVSLFLATPTAIDRVLVTNPTRESRAAVTACLKNTFSNAINFAFTDGEIAESILKELEARRISIRQGETNNNIVLLADWDTFYGRMWWAAFASKLARTECNLTNEAQFDFKTNGRHLTNLHTFYFLSGLDGRMLSTNREEDTVTGEVPKSAEGNKLGKVRWLPDSNPAEGPTQLDYLARLGDTIDSLHEEFETKGEELSAVVIAGGDVYDTLLILQELRPRFPHTVFVTTTLDARLWDTKELAWTRGVVVVSGFGLQLSTDLQGKNIPFRDSLQTAQYAAALRALGNTSVVKRANELARGFEIGWYGPIPLYPEDTNQDNGALLPPVKRPDQMRSCLFRDAHSASYLVLGTLCLILINLSLLKPFRLVTIRCLRFLSEPLLLTREDVGVWQESDLDKPPAAFNEFAPKGWGLKPPGWAELRHCHKERKIANMFLDWLPEMGVQGPPPDEEELFTREWAGWAARRASKELFGLRVWILVWFWMGAIGLAFITVLLLHKTPYAQGTPNVFFSGTSVWPTIWLCLLSIILTLIFLAVSFFQVRIGAFRTTRKWGLRYDASLDGHRFWPSYPNSGVLQANKIWSGYVLSSRFWQWSLRTFIWTILYLGIIRSLYQLFLGGHTYDLIRSPEAYHWYFWMSGIAYALTIFLTFWAIDAVVQCSRFVDALTRGPTQYPKATLDFVKKQTADLSEGMLAEWIDVQLVAETTGHLSHLIYFPVISSFVLVLAHNKAFYGWPWPWWGYVLAAIDLSAAAASILMLQHAATSARDRSVKELEDKIAKLKAAAAGGDKERAQLRTDKAKELLDDLSGLDKGVFAGFWANPVLGAFLIPPAGFELIELIRYLTK